MPEEPAAWLATIARNECWARIRAGMRRPLPTAEVEGERSPSDPLAEAIRRADLAAIWAALADLPQQQRDALLLREFGGLSYEELAVALAVSGPAVESLLFRARQGVRARLAAGYAGLTGGAWIDGLARLGSVIGGGMAPVAAKVAAVGVGAAVATGGAVVAPQLLEHRQHHAAPAPRVVTRSAVAPMQVGPVSVAHAALRHTVAAVRRSVSGTESSDDQAAGSVSRSTDHGTASGDERTTTSEHARDQETDGAQETGFSAPSRDGASSQDDQEADAPEPSDGTPPPAGDGGVAPTAPNPPLTVTVPTGDAPPVVGVPTPSSDTEGA